MCYAIAWAILTQSETWLGVGKLLQGDDPQQLYTHEHIGLQANTHTHANITKAFNCSIRCSTCCLGCTWIKAPVSIATRSSGNGAVDEWTRHSKQISNVIRFRGAKAGGQRLLVAITGAANINARLASCAFSLQMHPDEENRDKV